MAYVFLLLVVALAAWAIFAFNRLVRLRNQARTAWADIDVQLQRRHDLVPSLVNAVQAYAGHESATLQAVSELRTRALSQAGPARLGEVETSLERELGRLVALKESYPDLKADRNFAQLQQQLVEVEEQLQYARRFYNGAVRDLNDGIQRLPDAVIARAFGFKGAEFFQAEAGSRDAAKVEMPS
ncbi:MAG: LemA family protein [Thermomonas sp.]